MTKGQPSFPNFAGKHGEESMFTPADASAYFREQLGITDGPVPEGIVMCYSGALGRLIAARPDARELQTPAGGVLHVLGATDGRVGVASGFGIGAPSAATVLEELIASGGRRFLSIGAAGTLQRGLAVGSTILCTGAIRDEGVSHHYLPPARMAHPSPAMTQALRDALRRGGVPFVEGPAWTIDAPYRETVAEARHYQAEGVQAVEMEAAALFAVAQVRDVDIASVFVVSDSLAEMTWTPSFGAPETRAGLERLLEVAIECLCG